MLSSTTAAARERPVKRVALPFGDVSESIVTSLYVVLNNGSNGSEPGQMYFSGCPVFCRILVWSRPAWL